MSYADIVAVLMYADDDAVELAQEWLEAIDVRADVEQTIAEYMVIKGA